MKRLAFIFITLFSTHFSNGQNIEFNIHSKKLNDLTKIEQSLGIARVVDKSNYISEQGIAQPEVYRRQSPSLPDLFVYYFYYKSDSTISHILYEWDEIHSATYKEGTKNYPRSPIIH